MARRRRGPQAARARNRNLVVFAVLLIGAAVVIGLIIRGRGTGNADQNEPVQPPIDTNVVPDDNDNGDVQPVVPDETASDDNEAPPLPPMEIDVDPNAEPNPQAGVLVGEAVN